MKGCTKKIKNEIKCDLYSSTDVSEILRSNRLGGVLVRCKSCGLHFFGERDNNFTFEDGSESLENISSKLKNRVDDLGLFNQEV